MDMPYCRSFLLRKKWNSDEVDELSVGDLVLFEYKSSAMNVTWKLGRVANLEHDSDGISRIVSIEYTNCKEIVYPIKGDERTMVKVMKHESRKATNRVVKIYSCGERDINSDIRELVERIEAENQ